MRQRLNRGVTQNTWPVEVHTKMKILGNVVLTVMDLHHPNQVNKKIYKKDSNTGD